MELAENYYNDPNTFLTSFEDGVYAVVSKLYGILVYADDQRVEVKSFQYRLRNQACGLCGDLNDEKMADMKSANKCVMSSPKLSAYSYMVNEKSCQGIPSKESTIFNEEKSKCIQKEILPTKLTPIFNGKKNMSKKHLLEESSNRVCISRSKENICKSKTFPVEIIIKEIR